MSHKFDFESVTSQTSHYNFHTHTPYCDGHDSVDGMCAAARDAGFLHLGFSPHSPVAIDSPCNMSRADVPAFLNDIAVARQKFPELKIYSGMEVDFFDDDRLNISPQIAEDAGLEFTISSVHFVRDCNGVFVDIDGPSERFARNLVSRFDSNLRLCVERFFASSMLMVRQGGFDVIGHFDKIGRNASVVDPDVESAPYYVKLVNALIDGIISSGVTVEINTKAYHAEGRFFPHQRYWKRLVDARVPIIVNSDAHYSGKLNAGRDSAIAMLAELRGSQPITYSLS